MIQLLHGLGSSSAMWDRLIPWLPDSVPVHAHRLPWDAADGDAWAEQRDSRVWLEAALRPGPAVYLAHSFAANVLLDLLVARGTTDCRGLVLFSPFYRPSPNAFDWAALSHYLNDFDDLIRDGILAQRGAPKNGALLEAMVGRVRDRIGPYGWLRFFDLYTRAPFLDLSKVDVPCLVVAGDRDTAAYPHDCASLAAAMPDARLELLADCGHFTVIDQPARTGALVASFLRRLEIPAGSAAAAKGGA